MKIIDLPKVIKQRQDDENMEWFKQGYAELFSLDPETADKIVTFIVNYLLLEIKVSLGLVDVDPEVKANEAIFEFSNKVREMFEQSDIGIKITGREE
jgi:hypothetical protein